MADVWISRKKWTCKYCDVTINDDLPSRRHHETGVRHKQNVQKALQDLYRKSEQGRKDAEHTKKQMEQIEALAAASYAKDQAAAGTSASATAPSATPMTAPSAAASSSKASTGTVSRPSARRPPSSSAQPEVRDMQPVAEAGQWEQVEQAQPAASSTSTFGLQPPQATDRDQARSFRVREKVGRLDDSDDDDDLGARTIKIKKRPRTEAVAEPRPAPDLTRPDAQQTHTLAADSPASIDTQARVKKEESEDSTPADSKRSDAEGADTNAASAPSGGGGLFKKRRPGAGAGTKRVRAVI